MKINFNKVKELSLAMAGKHNLRYRHFSFIFDRGRIVSIGWNQEKTHPVTLKYNYWSNNIHAEWYASYKLGLTGKGSASNLVIVNTRLNRFLDFRLSKPCRGCTNLCKHLGFSQVYYTDTDGKFCLVDID